MTKEELAQQLLRSKGGTKTVSTNSRESLYDSLINANKPSPKNKVTVSKPSVSTTNRPSSTVTPPKSFTNSLRSFWGDVQKVGIGGAIADRLIPSKDRQPQAVAEKNVQTFVQKPLQEAEVVERTGRQGTAGFVGAISPVLDFMAFAHSVDKDTMNRIANAKGQPKLIQTVAKNYGDMQGSKSESVANISGKVKELESKISVKDPNAIDEVVKAFGSTLAFFVAGIASGGASLPTLLETYGNMGEVVQRTEGKPIDERNKRVLTDGVVNGVVNYFTNKFGLFSTEEVGLKKILNGFMEEAFQEGEQALSGNITSTDAWGEYWQKLIENKVKKKPMFSGTRPLVEEMFQGVGESTLLGGIMGSMFSLADLSPNTDTTVEEKDDKKATKVEETRTPTNKVDNITKAPEPAKAVAKAEVDPLIAEAGKYKSAEEFVKAQGQSVFRGGDTAIDTARGSGRGISVSDKETAGLFTPPEGGLVDEAILPKTAKILKEGDIPKNLQDAYIKEAQVLADPKNFSTALQKSVIEKQQAIVEYARKNGFDAVDFPFEKEIRVVKPNVLKTKSQLTDIWNKAQPTKGVDPLIQEARKYKSAGTFDIKLPNNAGSISGKNTGSELVIDGIRGYGDKFERGGVPTKALKIMMLDALKDGKTVRATGVGGAIPYWKGMMGFDIVDLGGGVKDAVFTMRNLDDIKSGKVQVYGFGDFSPNDAVRQIGSKWALSESQLTDIWNKAQTGTISEADKKDFEGMGLKVPEDTGSAKTTTIPEAEKQIQDTYVASQDKVDQAFSEVFTEMEIAEAGKRIFLDQPDSSQRKVVGVKSTFPDWIPEDLRSRKLFDAVMSGISGDVTKLKFPDKNRTKQRQLYNAILAEVDKRSGVDTSEARSAILDLYEKPVQNKETKQAPKPTDRSSEGRKEATGTKQKELEEEIDKYLSGRTIKFRFGEDVTTSILKELGDRETVSKQFILDLTNKGDIKQVEKDLIRKTLESYPDKVNVRDFRADVTSELLLLKTKSSDLYKAGSFSYSDPGKGMLEEGTFTPKYEGISLPDNLRGNVASYQEVVYESPIENSAGSVHFSYQAPNYFGHTRIENMADDKTRRVIEVQSDLYQKDRLSDVRELTGDEQGYEQFRKVMSDEDASLYDRAVKARRGNPNQGLTEGEGFDKAVELEAKYFDNLQRDKDAKVAGLYQYNNPTAHFRMVREEARKAFLDGKDTLLFPTGETAMTIEGLVGGDQNFLHYEDSTPLKITDIKRGQKFNDQRQGENFIITEDLGNGNFKAIPLRADAPEILNEMFTDVDEEAYYKALDRYEKESSQFIESASVSDGVDKNDPIYKFYEKDLARYLRSKYNATTITDENGVTWNEVKVTPRMGETVEAFRVKDDVEKITGKKITDEQEAKIIALNKRLFGDENVKITLQIMANRGALGSYKESIIQILDGQAKPKDTYYHEAVHKYLDIFTTRQEQIELFKEGIEKYGTEDLATVEEKIAEDFISYAKSREGVTGRIKSIFDSILARINAYLGNADAIDKLYQDILSPAEKKVEKLITKSFQDTQPGLPVGQGKAKESAFLERVKEQHFFNDPTSFEFDEQTGKYNEMNLEENAQRATDFIVSNPKEAIAVSLGLINPPQGVTANAIGLGTMLKARDEKNFNLYRDIATSVTLRSTRLGQEIVSLRGQMNDNSPENFVKRAIDARMRNISKSLLKDVEVAGRSLSDTKKEVTKKIDQETVKLKKKLSKDKIKIQKAQDIIDALRC